MRASFAMEFPRLLLLLLLTCLLSFSPLKVAAAGNGSGSVFVYATKLEGDAPSIDSSVEFVFALNADQSNDDLYIHMSSPSGHSWMAVGIGHQMQGALMFVAYPSSYGGGMTVSPRIATGHSEPTHTSDVQCDLISNASLSNDDTVTSSRQQYTHKGRNGAMTLNAVCHNALKWNGGSLDIGPGASKNQAFIFALGPGLPMASDSLTASMREHDFYGQFYLDMTQASSTVPGVPLPNGPNGTYVSTLAFSPPTTHSDSDPAPAVHGFIMCLSLVILFPLGALLLRVLNRVVLHAVVQGIALLLVTCSCAIGLYISSKYNKSKHINSPHQVIGILLWLALVAQFSMGILHHRLFKRTQQRTVLSKIHLFLGPAIILVGLINAGLGFNFADNAFLNLPYTIIVIVFAIGFVVVRGCVWLVRKRRTDQRPGPEGYEQPRFEQPAGVSGVGYAPAPYAPTTGYSQNDEIPLRPDEIPLRPYENQTSGIENTPPQYPRPMV